MRQEMMALSSRSAKLHSIVRVKILWLRTAHISKELIPFFRMMAALFEPKTLTDVMSMKSN